MSEPKQKSSWGLDSIFDRKTPKLVKLFYLSAYILSLSALIVQTKNVFRKWYFEPDISQTDRFVAASEVPAPAITICPPIAMRRGFANYSDFAIQWRREELRNKINLTTREKNFMAAGIQVCIPNHADKTKSFFQNRSDFNIVKLLSDSSFEINEVFKSCVYKGVRTEKCERFFSKVLTDEGFCYTFNMQDSSQIFNEEVITNDFDGYKRTNVVESLELPANEQKSFRNLSSFIDHWTLSQGYTSDEEKIPYRATPTLDVIFIAQTDKLDIYDLCNKRRAGFKIIYHMPNEVPTIFHDHQFNNLNLLSISTFAVKQYDIDELLKKYPIDTRQCYLENEKKLKFFKSYTKAHCNLECLTNFTLLSCSCVKYSMPRTRNTPVCDLEDVACYLNAFSRWPKYDPNSNRTSMPCNCYPPCKSIKYSVKSKAITGLSSRTSTFIATLKSEEIESKEFVFIKMIFNDFQHHKVESFVAYHLQNFIADCGGLFGLFLGISVLSIVNMTLNFIVDNFLRLRKDQNRSVKQNLKETGKVQVNVIKVKPTEETNNEISKIN